MTEAEQEVLLQYVNALRKWAHDGQLLTLKHMDAPCGCGFMCEEHAAENIAWCEATPKKPDLIGHLLPSLGAL